MRLLPKPAARIVGGLDHACRHASSPRSPNAGMRQVRGGDIAMIFQEPMTSLNPVLSIGRQLIEAIRAHRADRRAARRAQRALEALDAGAHPRAGAAAEAISARAFRRHAPARDDRHGAGLPPEGADRRRADDGARRDRAGADPRADARPAARDRHGGHPDHPRHGRGRRDGRPRASSCTTGRMVEEGRSRRIFAAPAGRLHARCCSPRCRGIGAMAGTRSDADARRRPSDRAEPVRRGRRTSTSASTCAAASSAA